MSLQLARPLPARSPVSRTRAANATLVERSDVTATLASFTFALDQPPPAWRAGQYVSVGVERGGELVQRPYSIVSLDATGTRLELFIRRLPDGRLSNILWALDAGTRVRVGMPKGLFVLDREDPRPRLFIGSGAGLAPLLAMLDDLAQRGDHTQSVLIHGVSWQGEVAYGTRVRGWQAAGLPLDYRPTVSRPTDSRNAGWHGRTGRAEAQLAGLLDEMPEARGSVAYICGNPDMVAACTAVLREHGVGPADVRAERFHAPGIAM